MGNDKVIQERGSAQFFGTLKNAANRFKNIPPAPEATTILHPTKGEYHLGQKVEFPIYEGEATFEATGEIVRILLDTLIIERNGHRHTRLIHQIN